MITRGYSELDATALADLVRRGEATPRELTEEAIHRIEAKDGMLNAVVHRSFEQALEAAAGQLPDGPFRGVPFLLKDLGASLMKGQPNYCGSAALRKAGNISSHDSNVTRRFLNAGLIVIGRTNVPEFGPSLTTEPRAFGPTRNPWDLDCSPGGSSGGSAAAVAAGYVPAAHASDGGGSVRVPASATGLIGLKPTRGRISQGPDEGEAGSGLATETIITRTVRDTASLLDVLAGYMPGDPYTAPPPPPHSFRGVLTSAPARLRVGVMVQIPGFEVDPVCAEAADHACTLLAECGHVVERAWPGAIHRVAEEVVPHVLALASAGLAAGVLEIEAELGYRLDHSDLEPLTIDHIEQGRRISAADHIRSRSALARFTRAMAAWWELDGWDLLVSPTMATPPFPLGYLDFDPSNREQSHRRMIAVAPYPNAV